MLNILPISFTSYTLELLQRNSLDEAAIMRLRFDYVNDNARRL